METKSLQRTNTSAIATTKPKALEIMAARLSVDPGKMLSTLKSTVFQKASDEEMLALVVVANEYGLNPFLKEIYAFPAKGGGIVPIVSVDGWNKMLVRHPDFDGIEFEFQESADDASEPPVSCTATIYLKNRTRPVKVTEYFEECKRNTDPWNNMPRRMLRNRTLCQGVRLALGFSGVHDEDEAIDITATVIPHEPPPKRVGKLAAPTVDEPPQPTKVNIRAQFQAFLDENEIPFNFFKIWAERTGNISNADSCASLDEVKEAELERLLRNKAGLLAGLNEVKAEAAR